MMKIVMPVELVKCVWCHKEAWKHTSFQLFKGLGKIEYLHNSCAQEAVAEALAVVPEPEH